MQWTAARKSQMIMGAYHFFRSNVNAIAQAQKYISVMQGALVSPKDFLIVDFETLDGAKPCDANKAAASFCYEIEKKLGSNIVIYTGYSFWKELINAGCDVSWAKKYKLWLAGYPYDPSPNMTNPPAPFRAARMTQIEQLVLSGKIKPMIPAPWTHVDFWQFTAWADSRDVLGHPAIKSVVDVNYAYGDAQPGVVVQPVFASTEYRVTADVLNVRTGPSTLNPSVRFLRKGDLVGVVSIVGTWARLLDGTYCSSTWLVKA
jgi:hypothetical protein